MDNNSIEMIIKKSISEGLNTKEITDQLSKIQESLNKLLRFITVGTEADVTEDTVLWINTSELEGDK